jgi:hypothetical protein
MVNTNDTRFYQVRAVRRRNTLRPVLGDPYVLCSVIMLLFAYRKLDCFGGDPYCPLYSLGGRVTDHVGSITASYGLTFL